MPTVDGLHIRTLMLTFFFRFMRPLIENGHVFIAQPPLYKLVRGQQVRYAFSDRERDAISEEMRGGNKDAKIDIQRNKGLGEMGRPRAVGDHHGPRKENPHPCDMADAALADETFTALMGDKVEPRRQFIEEYAKTVVNLDV